MSKAKRAKQGTAAARKQMIGAGLRARGRKATKARGLRKMTSLPLSPDSEEKSLYSQAFKLAKRKGRTEEVVALLRKSHQRGDSRATYALASWYINGVIFKVAPETAIRLLQKAHKGGVREATYDLAYSYETGFGVSKSLRKANDLYIEAAQRGDLTALHEVIRCTYYGIGKARDKELALLIQKLADELTSR